MENQMSTKHLDNRDIDIALRLSRKYIYNGAEPYAPAVMSFKRLIGEHRREIARDLLRLVNDCSDETLRDAVTRRLGYLAEEP